MKLLSFVFSMFIGVVCFGQDKMNSEDFPEMSRGIGVSFQKFENLNSRIAGAPQYKELPKAAAVLQLGWFKESHQFIHQLTVMGGSSMSGDRDKRSSTTRYIGAAADLGYDFVKAQKLAIFPLVGLSYQRFQARYFRDISGVSFDNVVQSPTTQSTIHSLDLTNGFFGYRLGAGIAARSSKYPCSIGLQAVYTGSFSSHAWKSGQLQSLANAPEDNLSQVYIGLVFTCRPFFMMRHGQKS